MTPEMPRLRLPLGRYRGRVINPAIATARPEPTCSISAPGVVALSTPPSPSSSAAATAHGNSAHDGGCGSETAPSPPDHCCRTRTPSSAGVRARRCGSMRWPTNRAAALRLGAGLGDLPLRVLPHSPRARAAALSARPAPVSTARTPHHRLPQALRRPRTVGRPTLPACASSSTRQTPPNTSPPYSYGRGQPRLGRGRLSPTPPGQEMDRIHVGLLVRPSFPLPVPPSIPASG
jgi:hypothetical protein